MNERREPVNVASRRRTAAAAALAGTVAALVLLPLAARFASGASGARHTLLVLLLVETVYVLVAGISIGGSAPLGNHRWSVALPVVLLVALALAWGVPLVPFAAAQPAQGGAAVLAWGIGRRVREPIRHRAEATAVAWILCGLVAISLLPLSHLAPWLGSQARISAALLALNPFVAVAHAAGFDLLRSEPLYGLLTLSDYPFRYPHPLLSPFLTTALGLLAARPRSRRLSRHRSTVMIHPPRKEVSA